MATDPSLLLSDALDSTGPLFDDEIEMCNTTCCVDDLEVPLVSVPKTTNDFPAGLSIPMCTHLGVSKKGD